MFQIRWPGIDGLQGPVLSGTGFYMKREALYGNLSEKGKTILLDQNRIETSIQKFRSIAKDTE